MNIIEGLKACCGESPHMAAPFRFVLGEAKWIGASDGFMLAAVETDDPEELAAATGEAPRAIASVIAPPTGGTAVSVASLRAWCNEKPITERCKDCLGTRRRRCGKCRGNGRASHSCNCARCTVKDDGPCLACGGACEYDCDECENGTRDVVSPGVLGAVIVDRGRLAKVLASMPPTDYVMVSDAGAIAQLYAPWWRGALMPFRTEPAGLSVFPLGAP